MTKPNSTPLTQKRLRELLHYEPDTGVFTWIIRPTRKRKAGDIAGYLDNGYVLIGFNSKNYKAHRLAWLYEYGCWPSKHIDHIDGNPSNNRISNLREATQSENLQNQLKARADSKTSLLGASRNKNRSNYRAQIMVNGKSIHLGCFKTDIEAHDAYITAKRIHHPFGTVASKGMSHG